MALIYSFRFVDDKLNRQLIALLEKSSIKYSVDKKGAIHYSSDHEDVVENELIRKIRDRQFPAWTILSCPPDWTESYKKYMNEHDVPFVEELIDNQICFLLPRKYRPHSWKLEEPIITKPNGLGAARLAAKAMH